MTSSNLPTSISVSYQTILKANLSVVKNMLVCEAVLVSLSQGQSTWMVTTKKILQTQFLIQVIFQIR